MSRNKWVRSISFNRTNSGDVARLKLIGKKSFSRYIKKLLDEEIKRQGLTNPTPLQATTTNKTDTPQVQERVLPNNGQQMVIPPQQPLPRPFNPMLQGRQRRD